jgi:hypothetical protein
VVLYFFAYIVTFSCKTSNVDRPCRWHDAGTYDAKTKTGGPNGSIRFPQEYSHGANAGIKIAIDLLGQYFFRQIHLAVAVATWSFFNGSHQTEEVLIMFPALQSQ